MQDDGAASCDQGEPDDKKPISALEAQELAYFLALDLVQSQPSVVTDDELPALMAASWERRFAEVDKWFNRRLAEIKKHWKRELHIPSHRLASKVREYREAASLRQAKGYSWSKLGLTLQPDAFKRDPYKTSQRIRKGVTGLLPEPSKADRWRNLLALVPIFFLPRELGSPALEEPDDNTWARKKLEETCCFFLDVAERQGLATEELLDRLLFLYHCIAERAEPGKGAAKLAGAARVLWFGEAMKKWTPAEVEQVLGPPIARREEGEKLTLLYDSMSFEFTSGKFGKIVLPEETTAP